MKNKKSSILKTIADYLTGRAFVLVLKKAVGSSVGLKAWVIKFLLSNFWSEIVEPLVSSALVEIRYTKDKIDGNITVKKIEHARRSGNEDDYDNAADSAFD